MFTWPIVHLHITAVVTIANLVLVGAAARLGSARLGADSKQRLYAGLGENFDRLVYLFSTEAFGVSDSPAVGFVRTFATSTSSHSGSPGNCFQELNRAFWRGDARPPLYCLSRFCHPRIRAPHSPRLSHIPSTTSPQPPSAGLKEHASGQKTGSSSQLL